MSTLLRNKFQFGILSMEKVKASYMDYCNDNQIRAVTKSNQTF